MGRFCRTFVLVIVYSIALISTACDVKTRHRVLSFLFDGVPPLEQAEKEAPPEKTLKRPSARETRKTKRVAEKAPAKVYSHAPYAMKECGACHSRVQGNVVDTTSALCFRCHSDEMVKSEIVHAPVAAGECLGCHNPHQSPNEHLLSRKLPDLCWQCHDEGIMAGEVRHPAAEGGGCPQCHSPHSGEGEWFLLKPVPKLCEECHRGEGSGHVAQMLSEKAVCVGCHDPHSSKQSNLLR
jgi:predicted CXXCH cytochrome family protein